MVNLGSVLSAIQLGCGTCLGYSLQGSQKYSKIEMYCVMKLYVATFTLVNTLFLKLCHYETCALLFRSRDSIACKVPYVIRDPRNFGMFSCSVYSCFTFV
jgi:hypothetical protein